MAYTLLLDARDAERIAAGRKTQLRRVARRDELTGRMRHSMTLEPGATFDVQAAGAATVEDPSPAPVASIAVVAVRSQLLRDVTVEEAAAEGWTSLAGFADAWMARHDRGWPLLEEHLCPACRGQAVVDGERCPAGCDDVGTIMQPAALEDDQVLDVFDRAHGHRLVRVVEFRLEPHRYLHRRSHHLYTVDPRQALADAGEAVDPQTLERMAKTNRDAFAAGQMRRLDEAAGIEELEVLAREQGITDVRDIRRAVDRRLWRTRERAREAEEAELQRQARRREEAAVRRRIEEQITRRAA